MTKRALSLSVTFCHFLSLFVTFCRPRIDKKLFFAQSNASYVYYLNIFRHSRSSNSFHTFLAIHLRTDHQMWLEMVRFGEKWIRHCMDNEILTFSRSHLIAAPLFSLLRSRITILNTQRTTPCSVASMRCRVVSGAGLPGWAAAWTHSDILRQCRGHESRRRIRCAGEETMVAVGSYAPHCILLYFVVYHNSISLYFISFSLVEMRICDKLLFLLITGWTWNNLLFSSNFRRKNCFIKYVSYFIVLFLFAEFIGPHVVAQILSLDQAEEVREATGAAALDEDELGQLEEDIRDFVNMMRTASPLVGS